MSGPEGSIHPIYFVADESGSMASNINQLNDGLRSLLDAMQVEGMAASKVRFCVMGFDDVARTHLELADFRKLEVMPTLGAYNSRSFAAIFRELKNRIPGDVQELKDQNYLVNRPTVFFLTDGYPYVGDDWQAAHAQLVDPEFKPHPNILAFGIGAADAAMIQAIATKPDYAFIAAAGMDTGAALKNFMIALTSSVIKTGQGMAGGGADVQFEKPDGFLSIVMDTL